MKAIENKFTVLIFLTFLLISCTNERIKLDEALSLSYKDKDISTLILLDHRSASSTEYQHSSVENILEESRKDEKKDYSYKKYYFYFGTLKSQLLSDGRTKEMVIVYKNQKYRIYNDSQISYDVGFWNRSRWDNKGFRVDKIYVVIEDSSIDKKEIHMTTKNISENIEELCIHEKSSNCDLFNKLKMENKKLSKKTW